MQGLFRKRCLLLVAFASMTCASTSGLYGKAPTYLIPKHAEWRYHAANVDPPKDWNSLEFDDGKWKSGPVGIGYGDMDDRTVLDEMPGNFTSVYLRKEFEIDDAQIPSLYLYVAFDDGFVAYINGHQVALGSVTRENGQLTVELHESEGFEEFVIDIAGEILKPGKNVLAIEGHNASIDSSDFSLDPFLLRTKLSSDDSLLTADELRADLDDFEKHLLDQSSYLTRRGFDYKTALGELRASIDDETSLHDFAARLQLFVMEIGDCHAGVYASSAWPIEGFLPLRPADTNDGLAALNINNDELLDAECPYIESIDDIPLEQWMTSASRYVPKGSTQLIRRHSIEWLGLYTILRDELGVASSETVKLGLRSADGKKKTEQTLRLTGQGYSVAAVHLKGSRIVDPNIGYLRIPVMDGRIVDPIVKQIRDFKDTDGLIIDVRDNGGGSYLLMNKVYGFFVSDDAEPYVTNIASYRQSELFQPDHIAYRPTYRADWDGWNDAEKRAIHKVAAAFRPEWQPPDGQFSEWHYMVLSRERGGLDYFYYDKPVVVLSNAGSFSATDGFLSAFADLPQVTIVGEPSGGGSGATRRFQLRNTEVLVALSSMASFRPNGKTFDGNGIDVDVLARPTIADYTSDSDSVLERAVAVIREKR